MYMSVREESFIPWAEGSEHSLAIGLDMTFSFYFPL